MSFLIQKSWDQRPFAGFPRLIAGYHVFRRLSMPRHPPCTLSSLTTFTDPRHERRAKVPRPVPRAGGRRYERPTTRSDTGQSPVHHATDVALAKKVLDDLLAKTEDQCKPTPGDRSFYRGRRHRGSVRDLSKPSVEPLFTCQRTPDFSGPAERGRDSRQTKMPADSFELGLVLRSPVTRRPELFREPS